MAISHTRYSELDLLRTAAVLGMIAYHGAFDLQSFYGFDLDVLHGVWMALERIVANLFLLLVGISFAISYERTPAEKRRFKYLKRGIVVIACGCLVSIATYIVDAQTFVRFGVLHMIGVSILLLPLFVRLKLWNLLIAVVLIALGPWIAQQTLPTGLLLPLGFMPTNFATVDYFPLIPWFGSVLIGLMIGQMFYVKNIHWRTYILKANSYPLKALTFPGRHALIIYLLHQPILIALLWMVMGPWKMGG